MPNRLSRVMKSVKTRNGSHQQAFHVRKAAAGDRYAQAPGIPSGPSTDAQAQPGQEVAANPGQHTQPPPLARIEVQPLEIPWELGDKSLPDGKNDPVPAEIRQRFDPSNRSSRIRSPLSASSPVSSVRPGEDLLWGSNESEMLNRLRTGIVTSVKVSGSSCSNMLVKIEASDGVTETAYIRFDNLLEKDIVDLYGDMYDLSKPGDLSKRAAASYELAKAAGLDDLVPPTVYRMDEHDGLEPIMSLKALDELAGQMTCSVEELKSKLGNSAAIELWSSDSSMMVTDPWFEQLTSSDAASLNDFYRESPYMVELLRGAVFDYLAWTGIRSMADLVVCTNVRHRLHLVRNDLSFPDPIAMGTAYLEYSGGYLDGCPRAQYAPMLWSDLISQAAVRGYDEEQAVYEQVAMECARRLKGSRLVDLVRSLSDHGVSKLAAAAVLVRASFLQYGSSSVMRNPLLVAAYFSSVITGEPFDPGFEMDIQAMEESVNTVINKASPSGFDFVAEMRGVTDVD